jgi:hypothetical protein
VIFRAGGSGKESLPGEASGRVLTHGLLGPSSVRGLFNFGGVVRFPYRSPPQGAFHKCAAQWKVNLVQILPGVPNKDGEMAVRFKAPSFRLQSPPPDLGSGPRQRVRFRRGATPRLFSGREHCWPNVSDCRSEDRGFESPASRHCILRF